jgi:uncharacterized protein YbgA (DUF1722 family)/uncharacterized protein YbbK (DUF523 family)
MPDVKKRKFTTPVVVVSECLEFAACRYNGAKIPDQVVRMLSPHVIFVPVCPEVRIGLGVPRDPIRLVDYDGERRLVQPSTDRDITGEMQQFAESYLDSIEFVDGFILKGRSPSCGIKDVKLHSPKRDGMVVGKTAGVFAGAVLDKFSGLAIEDEGRLSHFRIREHFLTKLFALADFRTVKKSLSMRNLVQFQAENKLLLMGYNQKELRILGRIVANHGKLPFDILISEYEEHFHKALRQLPRLTSIINVLMHALGYFSKYLTSREKAHFLDSIEKYRDERLPLSAVVNLIQSWIVKYEVEYLAQQTFFAPYPGELMVIADSGKGRNID